MMRFALTNVIGYTMMASINCLLKPLNVERESSIKRCNALLNKNDDFFKELIYETFVESQLMKFVLFVKQKSMKQWNKSFILQSSDHP